MRLQYRLDGDFKPCVSTRVQQLHVVVALATRNRPKMLRDALQSITRLQIPAGVRMSVVVVENNTTDICRYIVHSSLRGYDFRYVLEQRIGIAHARNRAVAQAQALQADAVLFFDDDEIVAEDWLARLVQAWRAGKGLLIGGPVAIDFGKKQAGFWGMCMRRLILAHFADRQKRQEQRFQRGQTSLISTNNCLVDMRVFADYGLHYSPAYHTGSDRRFYRDVLAHGLSVGWAPKAQVIETWDDARVSIAYNFHRAGEQEKTRFHNCKPAHRKHYALVTLLQQAAFAALLTCCLPFTGSLHGLKIIRACGRIRGLLAAMMGDKPKLYAQVTGA